MTGNEEQVKKTKKFAVGGGDLPPSPTTSTGVVITTSKRPTRHHVKRRSSGRVHVSKLAPMARAHGEIEEEVASKKPMKRSQSNKSLTRLSSLEHKSGMTGFTPAGDDGEEVIQATTPPTTPPTIISEATPIEQPHSVILPEPTLSLPLSTAKKPLLKSQFVNEKKRSSNVASAAIAQQPSGITRTQQKLLLQREQSLIHDENNIAHPKNMIRLTREMEKIGKEYRCVRKYQDPMMDSLKRCCQQQRPYLTRPFSSSILQPTTMQPHMEQRRQILLKTSLQHEQHYTNEHEERWSTSATNFLDRLFFGNS